jgi:hypothetical protein
MCIYFVYIYIYISNIYKYLAAVRVDPAVPACAVDRDWGDFLRVREGRETSADIGWLTVGKRGAVDTEAVLFAGEGGEGKNDGSEKKGKTGWLHRQPPKLF